MVALFFLSVALGTAMSGYLAGYYSPAHERSYFGILGLIAVLLGALLAVFTKPISALMSGVR
jgi:POT family proton-dependent oligopeptide transporter